MELREEFKLAGIKLTPQRRVVYEVMQQLKHASMEQIINGTKAVQPDMTLSTVYRIIDSFCEAGLIAKFSDGQGTSIYDVTTHDHHHLFSAHKGVIDIQDQELTALIRSRVAGQIPDGEEVLGVSIQVSTSPKKEG